MGLGCKVGGSMKALQWAKGLPKHTGADSIHEPRILGNFNGEVLILQP